MTFLFATCTAPEPCEWELTVWSEADKAKREETHAQRAHGIVPEPRKIDASDVVNPAKWLEAAIDAARVKVAAGESFTWYDLGLPDPPNAKTALGNFAHRLHDLGIAHPIRFEKSSRPGTRGSAVAVWDGNPARCVDKCYLRRRSA